MRSNTLTRVSNNPGAVQSLGVRMPELLSMKRVYIPRSCQTETIFTGISLLRAITTELMPSMP